MADSEYINEDNPVYFSYAWANTEHPDIEKDVEKLCELLEDNNIFYKRDKENLCPYRWSINDAEKEIGEGAAIIVVISEKYLRSLHCLHEWNQIRANGKIWNRVFPIVLEDAQITKDEVFLKFYENLESEKNRIIQKQTEGKIPLTDVEKEAANAGYYFDDLKYMYQYLANYNKSKISLLRADCYKQIIDQLNNQLKNIRKKYTFYIPDGFIVEIHKGSLEDNPGCTIIKPKKYKCFEED